jgi:hypothetical protein
MALGHPSAHSYNRGNATTGGLRPFESACARSLGPDSQFTEEPIRLHFPRGLGACHA